ncbi:MAG: hypothetical protein AAF890_04410, partial [Pseudomonadota bacterium]
TLQHYSIGFDRVRVLAELELSVENRKYGVEKGIFIVILMVYFGVTAWVIFPDFSDLQWFPS